MRRWGWIPVAALLAALPAGADETVYANRTLRVGQVLSDGDLRGSAKSLIGLEVRRAIYAGHPVDRSDLGPPTLVRRNEVVTMSYRSGGIALRAQGRALGSGGAGEMVDVMNLVSRRTVRAVVVGSRAVEVRR